MALSLRLLARASRVAPRASSVLGARSPFSTGKKPAAKDDTSGMSNADITRMVNDMDASYQREARVDFPIKLTGRSGAIVQELYIAVGRDAKRFDTIVKQLEGVTRVIEGSGMVVDRFFTTSNYSDEECKLVLDLLLTDKEPLKSYDSIKNADVKEMIVDNEGNMDVWRTARKGIAALGLSSEVKSALETLAGESHLDLVKKVAAKAADLRAFTSKIIDAEVRSAVPLSKEHQAAVAKALPQYVPAGQNVNVTWAVDPAVLGGLMITMKNTTIDLSATTKLVEVVAANKSA